jgi:L-threonylcarbamoyladenylate synthase
VSTDPAAVVDAALDPQGAVQIAAAALEAGRVIALATDTVYGLAARVDDAEAIRQIYELKGRPVDRRTAVLVADVAQAAGLVEMDGLASRLALRFWPGPVTIVAARRSSTAAGVGDRTTIGVRCPDDDVVRAIAARVGPLAATSANRHGMAPPVSAAAVSEIFPSIGVVIDGGDRSGGSSTVVRVDGDELTVVREGPVSEARIRAVLDEGSESP